MIRLRDWSDAGRALAFVRENGVATADTVATALDMKARKASDALARCHEAGHVVRTFGGAGYIYTLPFPDLPAIVDRDRPLVARL